MDQEKIRAIYEDLFARYGDIDVCREAVWAAYLALEKTFEQKKKLLTCGNGGSAADAGHICSELLKSFRKERLVREDFLEEDLRANLEGALPAISLPDFTAFSTAYSNDRSNAFVFAQLVWALGERGDLLWAISTSGNSINVLQACRVARAKGLTVLGFAGENGGKMKGLCDVCVCVPRELTHQIQELHLPIYHTLCSMIEERFFGSL